MLESSVHYGDYLQLNKILHAQLPESERQGMPAHDEMLFIVIHQAYELWFKQLLYELESVATGLAAPAVNDHSPELQVLVHRLKRMVTILELLVKQIDVMETMHPMDFLDFRDFLRPASGFQSWQFKLLEARLGLGYQERFGKEYYLSQLKPEEVNIIKEAEAKPSVLQLLNVWLERMPYLREEAGWSDYRPVHALSEADKASWGTFFADYRAIYAASLASPEKNNLAGFDLLFSDRQDRDRKLSPTACRAALFIMLYQGYPILQLPFQLLQTLLTIDEQLSIWRYRHMSMVHRMIGTRIGTGGSTGRDYLKGALDRHWIFTDLASLTSFLIERRRLPILSAETASRLGYAEA